MTTEPTQTPGDKMLVEALLALGTMQNERDAYAAHIARESRISDSEMMSLLRRRSELADQLQRDLALSTQRIAELESRVKQLEGALTEALRHAKRWDTLGHQLIIRVCEQALSPSPPAVAQPEERWAKEKAHFAKGGRIQFRDKQARFDAPWINTFTPQWNESCMYRIHPDDDTPPVQTEEKPATAPLAVAEKLAEASGSRIEATEAIPDVSWYRHPSWPAGKYKQFRHSHTMAQNLYEFEFYDRKPATFQASTKE